MCIRDSYSSMMEANWGPARVFAKVKAEAPDKIDELYTAMGTLIHPGGEGGKKGFGAYDAVIAQALDQVGLDASFASVANSDSFDSKLREYHQSAMDEVGDDVGTPVIKLGDNAFFGPVITRVPEGEEAGAIFDHCLLYTSDAADDIALV